MPDAKTTDELLVAWQEAKHQQAQFDEAFVNFEVRRASFDDSRTSLEAARVRLAEANKAVDLLVTRLRTNREGQG